MSLYAHAQNSETGILRGQVKLDSTWSSKIYLSYLPSFDDIYTMSPEMIIAETSLNEKGKFQFSLEYLPEVEKLYRLHISKKSDSKSSLIIGGKHENFLILILDKKTQSSIESNAVYPPFKYSKFIGDTLNYKFQRITDLVYKRDSIASQSNRYKREFVDDKLKRDLLKIADSAINPLVSSYALYKSGFENELSSNTDFYNKFIEKWGKTNNSYVNSFISKKKNTKLEHILVWVVPFSILMLVIGFFAGKTISKKDKRIETLSVQERKILKLLQRGATNKEISDEFNIGISTAKSHVSSILTKMNVKSRKALMK